MSLRPPASSIWRRRAPALRRGEDELVVAPDQLVGPALDLAAGDVEQVGLRGFGRFLAWFVDVFEGLEGQDGGADLAGFAVPDEFHLALVLEEQEAVALRQRLALLDELDEVAALGLGELVVGGFRAGHGGESRWGGGKSCVNHAPGWIDWFIK